MPQSVFAQRLPGDIIINRVLQNPYVRATIANPKFTRNFDVPYGAGPNKTKDGVVNIDRHIPQVDVVNGRRYDPARPTAIHEIVEQHIADQLQEGHAHAGNQIYEMAHHAAERAERMWVEKHLGPSAWGTYQQHWAQWLAPIEHENPRNPPPNLDKYPYPHRNVHDAPRTQETEPVFARAERRIGVAPAPHYQNGGAVAYQAGGEVDGEEQPERMVAAPTLIGTSGTGAATGGGGFQVPPGYEISPSAARQPRFQIPAGYEIADTGEGASGFRVPPGYEIADEKRPKDEGAVGTVLRETKHEVLPLAAGVGTAALTGAALGTLGAGPVGTIVGGIGGGIAGGIAASGLQEWALKRLGLSDEEQRAVNREAHPYAALAGEAALPALFGRPSAFWKAGAAGTRLMESPRVQAAAGALLGGGLEAGQEAISGQDFDPKQIAAQAASMGVFSGAPTRLGRALMGPAAAAGERLGARFGGRPGEAVATEAGTEQAAAAGRQQEAADTGAGPSKTQGTASEAVEPVDGKNAGRIDQDYGKKARDYGARTEQVQQAGEVAPDVRAAMAAAQPTEPSTARTPLQEEFQPGEAIRPGAGAVSGMAQSDQFRPAAEPPVQPIGTAQTTVNVNGQPRPDLEARINQAAAEARATPPPEQGMPSMIAPDEGTKGPRPGAGKVKEALRSIFSTVSQQRGSSIVPIGDLVKESGLPIETVHEFIMGEIQAGRAMVYPSSRPYADYPKYVMDGAMEFPGQPEPFVTVTLKGPAVEPPPAAEPEGISPAKLRERIEAAYLAVTQGRKAEDVPLSKIRAQLPDLDRNTVDAGLLRILQGDATARMGKINNPRAITPEEREAAFSPGGDPLHLLWIQPSEPAAPPPKQTVGEILKARNAAARAARGEVIQGPRPGEGETAPTGEAEQRAGQRTLRVERGPVPDRADLPPERRGRVEQPPGGGGAAAPPPEPPVGGAGGGAGGAGAGAPPPRRPMPPGALPPIGPGGRQSPPPPPPPSGIIGTIRAAIDKLFDVGGIGRDIQMKVAPMATGTRESMAAVKDYANAMRVIDHTWSVADTKLERGFTPEQRERMYKAADEENVMRQTGEPVEGKGLSALTPEERAAVEEFQPIARAGWDRMRELGMVEGEGLPYYTPRMILNIASGEGGPRSLTGIGANLRTSTPQMLRRKYLTAEETETAAKARFGEEAELARDIRTMPLAMAKMQKAIAGRELINKIREIGKLTGEETVVEGAKPGVGWFTLDHPAFFVRRPRMEEADTAAYREAAKLRGGVEIPPAKIPLLDRNGNVVFDKIPLWVRGDFEGPLRSVLNAPPGRTYSAMMTLKGKTMSVVMLSGLIHNAVEWGRALPAMFGKVITFKVYFEGNRAKNDPAVMREFISEGMVPIGKRFFNQDITSIIEQPNLTPGRSWTSQVLAFVPGLFDAKAGESVKRAIDRAGDFWHNTLLWDRVADLQMGLAVNFRSDLMSKYNLDKQSATRVAAHWANRYAGALPQEAMSDSARKIANMLLFSRSFTLGNLGAMKDMVNGLPRDVRAQISRDIGSLDPKAEGYIKSLAQRKAISIVMLDMGLMYIGNSLLQSGLNVMRDDKTLSEEGQGYARRLAAAMHNIREHPLSLLQPLSMLESVSATGENEPGKRDRILVGYNKDGTAIYARNPAGKIGEEFAGYLTGPLDMLKRKLGTVVRPAWQVLANDKGFGRKVYDPNADTPEKYILNMGKIAAAFAGSQVPEGQLRAAMDLVTGTATDTRTSTAQALGPLAGVTFSRGAPGGPAVGEYYRARERHNYEVQQALPEIRDMIKRGEQLEARRRMTELGIPSGLQNFYVRTTLNPSTRLSTSGVRNFNRYATPEELERFQRARQTGQ